MVTFVNRARHAVKLWVVDYNGNEIFMRALKAHDDSAGFNSHELLLWRARALNGQLLAEYMPFNTTVEVGASFLIDDCQLQYTGAAAILAAMPIKSLVPCGHELDLEQEPRVAQNEWWARHPAAAAQLAW